MGYSALELDQRQRPRLQLVLVQIQRQALLKGVTAQDVKHLRLATGGQGVI